MPLCYAVCTRCLDDNRIRTPLMNRTPVCGRCKNPLQFQDDCVCPVCQMEHRRISSERSLQLNCSCGAKLSNIPFKPVFIFKKLSGSWVDTVVSGLIGKESKTQKVRAEQLNRFNQAIRKYEPNVGAWCAKTKEAFERTEWVIIHKKYSVSKVKGMRGADFEDFLQVLFRKIGYSVQ